ncbi:MAG TPA: lipocalin-like domain-containing protein [Woeseiaceae bacterium]|nr:lipocalin-like domain-containing protein [Woeseiaceae bacterium]
MKKVLLATVNSTFIAVSALLGGCDIPDNDAREQVPIASSRLSELLSPEDLNAYPLVLEPREFSFPADHGPHPEYRNEWWYVTGNLDAAGGERFGFELTIFRFALVPPDKDRQAESAWATDQVYIGHFALTNVEAERFHVAQRYARNALGLAGGQVEPFRVWVEDWHLQESRRDGNRWELYAVDGEIDLSLSLEAQKPPVLNGTDGLSQKSSERGNASYYYSLPRLKADGKLSVAGKAHQVSGLAWVDREWGSSALSAGQEGWDWFALQLDDGSELMYYNLRRSDGSNDEHSAGTFIPGEGEIVSLSRDDVTVDVTDYWDSPLGGRYPMRWTITVPRLDLLLKVEPVLEAQELATNVRYWEGAVDVTAESAGKPVAGRGYVELTGYAR